MHHLMLTTGDCLWSPRSKIPKGVIDRFRPIVRAGGGRLDDTEWFVQMLPADVSGGAAFAYYHGGPRDLGGRWMGICYLAWTEAGAKVMWPNALKCTPLVRPGVHRPALPWLAGAITPAALTAQSPELLFQLSDMERCVGWAVYAEATYRENA